MSSLSSLTKRPWFFPLIVFLAIDCIFLLLHLTRKLDDNLFPSLVYILSDPRLSISMDGGFAEMWQYVKEFGISAMFLILFLHNRKLVYLGWSVLFLYLLLDDSIQIHETGGAFLVNVLHMPHLFGIGPQSYGELLIVAVAGLIFLPSVLIGYYRADRQTRSIVHHIVVLFAALVFCGVITDFFDMFATYRPLRNVLVVLEDGGEMIVMTCIFAYVYRVLMSPQIVFLPDFQLPWLPQPAGR